VELEGPTEVQTMIVAKIRDTLTWLQTGEFPSATAPNARALPGLHGPASVSTPNHSLEHSELEHSERSGCSSPPVRGIELNGEAFELRVEQGWKEVEKAAQDWATLSVRPEGGEQSSHSVRPEAGEQSSHSDRTASGDRRSHSVRPGGGEQSSHSGQWQSSFDRGRQEFREQAGSLLPELVSVPPMVEAMSDREVAEAFPSYVSTNYAAFLRSNYVEVPYLKASPYFVLPNVVSAHGFARLLHLIHCYSVGLMNDGSAQAGLVLPAPGTPGAAEVFGHLVAEMDRLLAVAHPPDAGGLLAYQAAARSWFRFFWRAGLVAAERRFVCSKIFVTPQCKLRLPTAGRSESCALPKIGEDVAVLTANVMIDYSRRWSGVLAVSKEHARLLAADPTVPYFGQRQCLSDIWYYGWTRGDEPDAASRLFDNLNTRSAGSQVELVTPYARLHVPSDIPVMAHWLGQQCGLPAVVRAEGPVTPDDIRALVRARLTLYDNTVEELESRGLSAETLLPEDHALMENYRRLLDGTLPAAPSSPRGRLPEGALTVPEASSARLKKTGARAGAKKATHGSAKGRQPLAALRKAMREMEQHNFFSFARFPDLFRMGFELEYQGFWLGSQYYCATDEEKDSETEAELEDEYQGMAQAAIRDRLPERLRDKIRIVPDSSVKGGEIVTQGPMTIRDLLVVLKAIFDKEGGSDRLRLDVDTGCSFHVHLSVPGLEREERQSETDAILQTQMALAAVQQVLALRDSANAKGLQKRLRSKARNRFARIRSAHKLKNDRAKYSAVHRHGLGTWEFRLLGNVNSLGSAWLALRVAASAYLQAMSLVNHAKGRRELAHNRILAEKLAKADGKEGSRPEYRELAMETRKQLTAICTGDPIRPPSADEKLMIAFSDLEERRGEIVPYELPGVADLAEIADDPSLLEYSRQRGLAISVF
jgi:hypothetical protein